MSEFTPDRYRDRSIVAQTSAKCASEILAGNSTAGVEDFFQWQDAIFENTLKLAGEDTWETDSRKAEAVVTTAFPGAHVERPNASFKMPFGKHKGWTLQTIHDSVDDSGKANNYLDWFFNNTDNEELKGKVGLFLGKV